MRIKYLSGPKAGQIDHVQNHIGNVVVGAGLAERLANPTDPGAGPRPQPQWSVEIREQIASAPFLSIRFRLGAYDAYYAGAPLELTARAFGRAVPESVAKEYAELWLASPELRKPLPDKQEGPHPDNAAAQREKDEADRKFSRRVPSATRFVPVGDWGG